VHTALVLTPMISPTTMYDKFPALTPDQADAVNPAVLDRLRNRAFSMFEDSSAATGDQSGRRPA